MKVPFGVSAISYFYVYGALLLLFTGIFYHVEAQEMGVADRYGLNNFPEQLFLIILALLTLIVVYGYMTLKPWGYWLMIFYSIGFGLVSFMLVFSFEDQLYIWNGLWAAIVVIYCYSVRKHFFKMEKKKNRT